MAFATHTPRHELELFSSGQAQADESLNESMAKIDALECAFVVSHSVSAQPGSPTDGQTWIVGSTATGAEWEGHDSEMGIASSGSPSPFLFVTPKAGMRAFIDSLGVYAVYNGTAWKKFVTSDWSTSAF